MALINEFMIAKSWNDKVGGRSDDDYILSELQECGFVGPKNKRNEQIINDFVTLVHQLHVTSAQYIIGDYSVFLQPAPNRQQYHLACLLLLSYHKRKRLL